MGFVGTIIGSVAAWLLFRDHSPILAFVAVGVTLMQLWSWGVMHNQATNAARRRAGFKGGFFDFTASEGDSVSDRLAATTMVATLALAALLIVALLKLWL